MIRLSYQPLYMPFIAQNFTGTTCYECGQLASEGGARAGRWWGGGGVLVGQDNFVHGRWTRMVDVPHVGE